MPLNPPQGYRKTQYTHRRGDRASQPSASDVLTGSLYYVTDEALLERSNGTDWEAYGQQGSVTSNLVKYTYSSTTTSPPASKQVRFNAAHPYTAVTKLFFDITTLDSENIRVGLLRITAGSLIYIQDKNDDTKYATFQSVAAPTDHTTWIEFDVIHYDHGSAIGGGSQVLAQSTWGSSGPGGWPTTSVSLTGSQDNLVIGNAETVYLDNATDITITGIAGGIAGRRVRFVSRGAGNAYFANETTSTAANRLTNFVTSGLTPLHTLLGVAEFEYDGSTSRWKMVYHEQGNYIDVAYNSGDFTASGSMTWTVDSGDVTNFKYWLRGRQMTIDIDLETTTIGGSVSNQLLAAIPGGYTVVGVSRGYARINNGGGIIGFCTPNGANLQFLKTDGSNFALSTNLTQVGSVVMFEVA